jgi:parvulin-like peptidyl-prolyl isomerase
MEIGEISEPIETPNGWIVIQLIDKRTKTLTQSEYQNLQQTKYTDWLAEQRSALEGADNLTINEEQWQASVPTRPAIPLGMELPTPQPQQ